MRVAYVVHQFLPRFFSGTEQYVYAIARWMQAQGHDVRIFTLEPSFVPIPPLAIGDDEVDGLPVTRIRFDPTIRGNGTRAEYEHPFVGYLFGEWLDRVQPGLVHVFHLRYLGGNLLHETWRRTIPTVVHLMDFWFLCPRFTLLRHDDQLCDGPPDHGIGCLPCTSPALARLLAETDLLPQARALAPLWQGTGFRSGHDVHVHYDALVQRPVWLKERLLTAAAIVAPSHFLRSMFVRNGYPKDRIAVLTYGTAPVPRLPREPGEGRLRAGFLGTIAHHKGLHVAVAAMAQVGHAFELQVHGRTTDHPEYAQDLLERTRTDARIVFRGPYDRASLPRVLAGLDLVVVPSIWYENTPFVVLEAQSAGVPVFASDLGGLSELVQDGLNGELFRAGDASDLARRLARAGAEPARLDGYRQRMESSKTIVQNAAEIEALYSRVRS